MHEKREEKTVEGIALDCGGSTNDHRCSVGACATGRRWRVPLGPLRRGSRGGNAQPATTPATGRGCKARDRVEGEDAISGVRGHWRAADSRAGGLPASAAGQPFLCLPWANGVSSTRLSSTCLRATALSHGDSEGPSRAAGVASPMFPACAGRRVLLQMPG